ncbi:MAG: general secretion pathway protein GspE [Myxococcales bacterium]|nr:general secretion pathway protein GspE [Myxococcales bacterium]
MPTLGEMLVADGACTREQVEDAVHNQVVMGGRLGTNLIEAGAIGEEALARALARLHNLPAMSGDHIQPEAEALRLLSPEVADRLEIIPFARNARKLQVLCVDPRNVAALDEAAFITGFTPEPVVVPEFRFFELLLRCYGIERHRRFVSLARADFLSASFVDAAAPRRDAQPAEPAEDLISEEGFARLYQRRDGFPLVSRPASNDSLPLIDPADLSEISESDVGRPPGGIERRVWQGPLSGEGRRAEDRVLAEAAAARPSAPPPPAEELALPLSFAAAAAELQRAQSRDAIARSVLRYGQSLFRRCLLTTIHRRFCLGWDGIGPGVDPWSVRSLMIPLDEPSVFELVERTRSHVLGSLSRTRVNVNFLRLLGREVPLSVFAMPILVRGRVVNIFYGDNGHKKHAGVDVADLLILSQRISQSYEEIFQQKRRAGTRE